MFETRKEEYKLNVTDICTRALEDLQPDEDIDEALLRTCKALYGEKGTRVFQILGNAFENKELFPQGMQKLEKVKMIAQKRMNPKERTISSSSTRITAGFSKVNISDEMSAKIPKSIQCRRCGYKNPEDTNTCINCHSEFVKKKKSFWDKLLGR